MPLVDAVPNTIPPSAFPLDEALLAKARAALWQRTNVYWLIGGSGTGKSTLAQAISSAHGLPVYDMDSHIYEAYMPRYRPERHPACLAWFRADNPLAWVMALSWESFEALNRASNAEFLDLLAEDLGGGDRTRLDQSPRLVQSRDQPLLVDGGFTHPSVLVRAVPPAQVVCLDAADAERAWLWENDPERAMMRQWIADLPEPEAMWGKFLDHDRRMNDTLVRESVAAGVRVFRREAGLAVADLAQAVANHWGL